MAQPLEMSYHWRTPVVVATIGLVLCVGLLARGQAVGWPAVVAVLVALWTVFVVVVWLRTRAYLLVDGSTLVVRRFFEEHRIEGASVTAVTEFLTPSGPSYKLTVRGVDGQTRRYVVPTALLRQGHSTLFAWILAWAPAADLDRRSRRTLEQLQVRGLLG